MRGYRIFIWQDRESMLDADSVSTCFYKDIKNFDETISFVKALVTMGFSVGIDGGQEVEENK